MKNRKQFRKLTEEGMIELRNREKEAREKEIDKFSKREGRQLTLSEIWHLKNEV